jgi:CcmD family protein
VIREDLKNERDKGMGYVILAYGVIWVGLVLYLVTIARRLSRLEKAFRNRND